VGGINAICQIRTWQIHLIAAPSIFESAPLACGRV
jgi:hypothetical protein